MTLRDYLSDHRDCVFIHCSRGRLTTDDLVCHYSYALNASNIVVDGDRIGFAMQQRVRWVAVLVRPSV